MIKFIRDKAHCKHNAYASEEVYKKEEIDNLLDEKATKEELNTKLEQEPDVYSGTTEPTSSLGKDGDIYFQYVE